MRIYAAGSQRTRYRDGCRGLQWQGRATRRRPRTRRRPERRPRRLSSVCRSRRRPRSPPPSRALPTRFRLLRQLPERSCSAPTIGRSKSKDRSRPTLSRGGPYAWAVFDIDAHTGDIKSVRAGPTGSTPSDWNALPIARAAAPNNSYWRDCGIYLMPQSRQFAGGGQGLGRGSEFWRAAITAGPMGNGAQPWVVPHTKSNCGWAAL